MNKNERTMTWAVLGAGAFLGWRFLVKKRQEADEAAQASVLEQDAERMDADWETAAAQMRFGG